MLETDLSIITQKLVSRQALKLHANIGKPISMQNNKAFDLFKSESKRRFILALAVDRILGKIVANSASGTITIRAKEEVIQ